MGMRFGFAAAVCLALSACGGETSTSYAVAPLVKANYDTKGAAASLAVITAGYEVCAGEMDASTWAKGGDAKTFLRQHINANAENPRAVIDDAHAQAERFVWGARNDNQLNWKICSMYEAIVSDFASML